MRRFVSAGPVSGAVRGQRGGFGLVMYAILLFALFAFAAMVIDVGFVRLARQQLQSAADTVALEGLRFRDDLRELAADRDEVRRQRAADFARLCFDDDLDPGNGDDGAFDGGGQFGGGPIVNLTGGAGAAVMAAGRELSLGSPVVWKPQLELNRDDEPHGDMVSGGWDPAALDHSESASYVRADFEPGAVGADAFLVRLRRTPGLSALDSEAGVSSRGPSIPWLFARGSVLAFADPVAGYSPRHHGLTVRGTGVAALRSAVSVGRSVVTSGVPGGLSLAISDIYWQGWLDGGLEVLELTAAGELVDGTVAAGLCSNATGVSEGRCLGGVVSAAIPAAGVAAVVANVVGSEPVHGGVRRAWVAIYATAGVAAGRVVSLGCVDLEPDVDPERLQLTKRTGVVGWVNASAVFSEPLERAISTEVLEAAATLSAEALLVPILVR
ncbi:MAG: pilus assembly protein TadG-related protein [Planctomycetaceae bacterium]